MDLAASWMSFMSFVSWRYRGPIGGRDGSVREVGGVSSDIIGVSSDILDSLSLRKKEGALDSGCYC